jgi:hypothetical protein
MVKKVAKKFKVGQTVYAVLHDNYNNNVLKKVLKTTVTSIATIERDNNTIEVEYYYRDPEGNTSSDFRDYTLYTKSEFKKYLNECFFT